MSDQREYPPGPEHPVGHPQVAVPAGYPGVRPGPPAPPAAPPPRWPVPVARPSGPRPQPAGAVPLLTHEAAVGGWPSSGYPPEPAAPPAGDAARTATARQRPGYGPPPGPPPARSGLPAGDGRRHPAGSGGGGRRWPRRLLWSLVALLGLGLLAPVVAFLVGWVMFDVPSADQTQVTQVATFKYADGAALATIRPDNVNRTIVTLNQVPEHVRHAVLSAEDRSFYSNPGFDLTGIGRALWNQATGGVGGGSTITQQYVKVSTGQDSASLWRKYKEVVLAVKTSQEQSKDQILENYLNVIYLGRGAYGIQAASQAYFGKDVKDLSVAEGAMLAGTIQSPSRWDPAKNLEKSNERWNFVLDGMVAQGWLPAADRAQEKFPAFLPEAPQGGGIPGDAGGHVYKLAMDELAARGITDQEINTEGLTIDLTIDSKRQQQAVAAVTKVLKGQPAKLRGALVSVDPKTGAILAYYGGTNGLGVDYAQARRQPGSAFKPFVLSAALQDSRQKVGLGSTYDGSSPQSFLGVQVSNSEGFSCNPCTVQQAMTKSVNTVFYKMGIDAGPQRVVDAAHQAGIPSDELPTPTAGIALGDKEVRPIDMASAFATFAADGIHRDAFVVAKVTSADGRVIYDHGTASGQQAVPQPVARNVTEAMTDVASSGGIAPAGRAVAGKTGTVQHPTLKGQNKDAWMVGYTPSVSTAVWVGTDQSDPIKNSAGRPVFGRMLPGSIWQAFMTGALRGTPVEQFSPFVALGTPPSTATGGSTAGTDEKSDEKSDGDSEDEDKDKKKSDSDSSDSDHGSDGSDSSRSRDSGSRSGGSGSDDSSDEGTAFQVPRFTVPSLPDSRPVGQASGQQQLAAGTPAAG